MLIRGRLAATNGRIFIYAMCEPITGLVRYVGATEWLPQRAHNHMNGESDCTRRWIDRLMRKGLIPSFCVLDVVPLAKARTCESWWIAYYRRHGALLNKDLREYHSEMMRGSRRLEGCASVVRHSIRSLAKEIGCSPTLLSDACRGKMSISFAVARRVQDLTKSKRYPLGFLPNFENWPLLRRTAARSPRAASADS